MEATSERQLRLTRADEHNYGRLWQRKTFLGRGS